MTIRTRLSLWYAVIMFVALMAMGVLLYHQLIMEPRHRAQRRHETLDQRKLARSDDIFEDVTGIVLKEAVSPPCKAPVVIVGLAAALVVPS